MPQITTIEELVKCFDNAKPSERVGVLKSIDINKLDYEKYATWKGEDYTRNCIVRKNEFEFILLCWDIGSSTPIHGHSGEDCWVYQVDGEVRERRYRNSSSGFEMTNEAILSEGNITYMHDRMGYHTIENVFSERAMTLHVYANPIDTCEVYNLETSSFERKEMKYDSMEGKIIVEA